MDDFVPLLLAAPALGLAVNAAHQIVLSRLIRGAPLRVQFIAFGAGLVVAIVALVLMLSSANFSSADKAGYFMLHAAIYAAFGFCFFNVISANVSSLRIRLLKEYLAVDPSTIADVTLYARYSAKEMVSARLARLERGRQIRLENGRYFLSGRGVTAIGRLFAGLRHVLLGRHPETRAG